MAGSQLVPGLHFAAVCQLTNVHPDHSDTDCGLGSDGHIYYIRQLCNPVQPSATIVGILSLTWNHGVIWPRWWEEVSCRLLTLILHANGYLISLRVISCE